MAATMSYNVSMYSNTSVTMNRTSVIYIGGATKQKLPTQILSTSILNPSALEFTPSVLESPGLCELILWRKLINMSLDVNLCDLAAPRMTSLALHAHSASRVYGDGFGFNLTVHLECEVDLNYPSLIHPVNYNYNYGGNDLDGAEEEVLVLDDERPDYMLSSLWLGRESGGVSEAVIDRLRIKGMGEQSNIVQVDTCAVCLDDLMSKSKTGLLRMSCSHIFHDQCIVPWLERNNSCPMCRKQIT